MGTQRAGGECAAGGAHPAGANASGDATGAPRPVESALDTPAAGVDAPDLRPNCIRPAPRSGNG